MWSSPKVVGLFSINVVSFSSNVVLSDPLFSLNSVSKPRMLSVRGNYVFSSLHLKAPCRGSGSGQQGRQQRTKMNVNLKEKIAQIYARRGTREAPARWRIPLLFLALLIPAIAGQLAAAEEPASGNYVLVIDVYSGAVPPD